ncbi:hypothetical protein [Profundibacter amoris]|uniref:Uncharacterized protein n=1 Tax=Profundibacter amoris TaxID=2171755 RepID=A0A347UHL9_9RHOB|nr:hypothetical protein [Profundibacter amoris]AXX98347.1 hypothetical protein BAR1_10665 [Profundibacter amoris]
MLRLSLAFTFVALLGACSDFPQLDDAVSPAAKIAPYPSLIPIDQALTNAQDVQITDESVSTLKGRMNGLKNRTTRAKRPVIDTETRKRLQDAIDRHS